MSAGSGPQPGMIDGVFGISVDNELEIGLEDGYWCSFTWDSPRNCVVASLAWDLEKRLTGPARRASVGEACRAVGG